MVTARGTPRRSPNPTHEQLMGPTKAQLLLGAGPGECSWNANWDCPHAVPARSRGDGSAPGRSGAAPALTSAQRPPPTSCSTTQRGSDLEPRSLSRRLRQVTDSSTLDTHPAICGQSRGSDPPTDRRRSPRAAAARGGGAGLLRASGWRRRHTGGRREAPAPGPPRRAGPRRPPGPPPPPPPRLVGCFTLPAAAGPSGRAAGRIRPKGPIPTAPRSPGWGGGRTAVLNTVWPGVTERGQASVARPLEPRVCPGRRSRSPALAREGHRAGGGAGRERAGPPRPPSPAWPGARGLQSPPAPPPEKTNMIS